MDPITSDETELRQLVLQAQEGSTEAFGTLYDHFFDSVYRYVAFRLPSEMAEDVTADVFVKAWEHLHKYQVKKRVPFGAWLFRIARNTVIDSYRTQKKVEEVPDDTVDHDELNRAEARIKKSHLLKTMRSAMERLPTRYRDVLQLSYMADMPHSQIAQMLHMSEGSVRILKLRALRKLEGLLPPDVHDQ